MKNEKGSGWTTRREVIVAITSIIITVVLSALVAFYGINQTAQAFIKNNPDLPDKMVLLNAAEKLGVDDELVLTAFLSKYMQGSFDGNGQVDGSFKGRFTTVMVRSLEKVNLSCIDEYEFVKGNNYPYATEGNFIGSLEFKSRLQNRGCTELGSAGTILLWKCPLHNCQMREVTREFAGTFIPESIEVRKIQAGVNSKIGE